MTKSNINQRLMERRNLAVPKGPFHVAPIFAAKASGATIVDVEGKHYIDFCGGIGVQNVGHNHPKVVAAIKAQADAFIHPCFHVTPYESYVDLAEKLNERVPIEGPCKSVFFNSGAEAVENAIKIARVSTGRSAVVAFERGFHGRTLLSMTLTGKCRPYTAGFGPFAPEVYRLPYEPFFMPRAESESDIEAQCLNALEKLTQYQVESEAIAAIIVEPVLGEGGFSPIHPTAFSLLRQWTEAQGIILIADEVQAGFARCGAMFACETYNISPDLMTLAKSMAGGTVLSAVVGKSDLMEAPGIGGVGGTYGGNPLSIAAALAVLEIIDEENLCDRAQAIGKKVMACFNALKEKHEAVADARGLGAMCGLVFLDPKTHAPALQTVAAVCQEAREKGLLLMAASGNIIRTLMPLTIDDEQLDRGLAILSESVDRVLGR